MQVNDNDNDTSEWGLHKVSPGPTDSDGEVVTSTKRSLLNCGNPAHTGQASRVINICRLTDGYSHCFLAGRLNIPSAVDVLLPENHMCLLDFELNRDESLHHTDDFSVPVDDGADPSTPAPSGASSRFRSSIRTHVC